MEIVCLDLEGVLVPEIWIAFAEETGIPIHYIGIGEGIDQLRIFDRKEFVNALFGHEKN